MPTLEERLSNTRGLTSPVPEKPKRSLADLQDAFLKRDARFDNSGIPLLAFRAGLSRRDTDQEKRAFLALKTGKDGFTQDKYGRYAVTPSGMKRLGLEPNDKPTLIDKPGMEKGDIADMAGVAPSVIGGVGMATAATGVGFLPGMALAGLGAAGGKAIGEITESRHNLQSPKEVATDLLKEGVAGATGEGLARGAGALGRKILAPEASRMTTKSRQLLREAIDLGVQPKPQRLTHAPIQGRVQGMLDKIFGDPKASQNARALHREMFRLKRASGRKVASTTVGDAVSVDVSSARKALSDWAQGAYAGIDKATGNGAIFPTASLKRTASEILDALPKNKEGNPVFTSPEMRRFLTDALDMDDALTASQLQAVRQRLWDAMDNRTLVPGMSSRYAKLLRDAATESYDDAVTLGTISPEARGLISEVNKRYAREIAKFDDALISRIIRDPGAAGRLEPEEIVSAVFKKGKSSKLNRLNEILSEDTKGQMRREAMETLMDDLTSRGSDVLERFFDGKRFLTTLDKYGDETLDAMFGSETRKRLYRLGEITQLISDAPDSGGLVAAHIAVRPWANLSKLVKLRLISGAMNSKTGLKYLTEGLDVPNTRAASMFVTRLTALTNQMYEDSNIGTPNGSQ